MITLQVGFFLLFSVCYASTCKIRDCKMDNEDLQASLKNGNKVHFCRQIGQYLSCLKNTLRYCYATTQYMISSVMSSYGSHLPECNIDPLQYFVSHRHRHRHGYDDDDDDDDDDEDDEDERGLRRGNSFSGYRELDEDDEYEGSYGYRPNGGSWINDKQNYPYEMDDLYDDMDERGYGMGHFRDDHVLFNKKYGDGPINNKGNNYGNFYKPFGLQDDYNLYKNYGLKNIYNNPRIRPKINIDDVLNSGDDEVESDDLHDDLNDDIYDDKVLLKSKVRINKKEIAAEQAEELLDDLHDDKEEKLQRQLMAIPKGVKTNKKPTSNGKVNQPKKTRTDNQKSLLTSIPKASQSAAHKNVINNGGDVSFGSIVNLLLALVSCFACFV